MKRLPPRSTRPDPHSPYTPRCRSPAAVAGRHGTDARVEAQRDAIADRRSGQPANEAPWAHHQQAVPGARGDLGVAEAAAPQREQFLALLVLRPPALRQVAEREVRPAAAKIAAVAADVADEAVALTHLWLDADRQSQSLGDDLRGVQG